MHITEEFPTATGAVTDRPGEQTTPGTTPAWVGFEGMLFDLDGVITRTATLHAAAWKQLFDEFLQSWSQEHGEPFTPFDIATDYPAYVDGRPRFEGVATFLRSRGIELPYGAPDDPPGARTYCGLGNRKNQYLTSQLKERGVQVYPDTKQLIDSLRQAGKRLAVVSASENCTPVLRQAGLLDRFDVRITGVEAKQFGLSGKPAPDTFLKAAELLGVQPSDAMVFEDAIAGVQAARAGRFGLVVGVDRRGDPVGLASNGADIVLTDLTELLRVPAGGPAPDVVARQRLADRSFEAIVVRVPAASGVRDFTALHPVFDKLCAAGIDLLVISGDEPATGVMHQPGGPPGQRVACSEADEAEAFQRLLDRLEHAGIGAGLVLVVGWLDGFALAPQAQRAALVSVSPGDRPVALPEAATWVGASLRGLVSVLDDQLQHRLAGRTPSIDDDPAWTITVKGDPSHLRRVYQTLLTVADTRFGTRGLLEEEAPQELPIVLAAGVFDEAVSPPTLLEGPNWTGLTLLQPLDTGHQQRTLDLRSGVLLRDQPADPVPMRSLRFASLARPGTMLMRAEGAMGWLHPGPALRAPAGDGTFVRYQRDGWSTAHTRNEQGGAISAAVRQHDHTGAGRRTIERIACYAADPHGDPRTAYANDGLTDMTQVGFDALLAEHRAAWAQRWRDSMVSIGGDPQLELAVRFHLFHLMACAPTTGEAAIGARGVSGPAYAGHVFWDADVFVLPFLAATCPPAARAMLEYRIRRLGPARQAAAECQREGARFPWESARSGTDVTPRILPSATGVLVPIATGQQEEHIVADVAWAALHYAAWTGDTPLLTGEGMPLVLDTARYWASRVRLDGGRAHIDNVIGPDEYHESVDDNAFTNVMARWNLRRAAELVDATGAGASREEVARWRWIADALVDGYRAEDGLYEQFAGYHSLDPLIISQLASTPVAADLLLGSERVKSSQIIKQPDVLMLYHLVPEEVAAESQDANIDFYEPRCAHGSSLSPAIHAAVLARAGRTEEALRLFQIACQLDLDDLTGTTSGGLHIANSGAVWQALAYGFAGIRPLPGSLLVAPRLPAAWRSLSLRLRYRASRVEIRASHEDLEVRCEGPLRVEVPGGAAREASPSGVRWRRRGETWEAVP